MNYVKKQQKGATRRQDDIGGRLEQLRQPQQSKTTESSHTKHKGKGGRSGLTTIRKHAQRTNRAAGQAASSALVTGKENAQPPGVGKGHGAKGLLKFSKEAVRRLGTNMGASTEVRGARMSAGPVSAVVPARQRRNSIPASETPNSGPPSPVRANGDGERGTTLRVQGGESGASAGAEPISGEAGSSREEMQAECSVATYEEDPFYAVVAGPPALVPVSQ